MDFICTLSLGKSPLHSSPSVPSSNAATSRPPSGQSDYFTQGSNTLGPMPSTLSVGDYNKLLVDTKRLMSNHQLPYVAKLTTDSSGDDSDRTNLTNNTDNSSKETPLKSVTTQCISPPDKVSEKESIKAITTAQVTQHPTTTSSEHKVMDQLPPLSPPSVKKQSIANIKSDVNCTSDTTPSKALMVNGTKYQPVVTNANLQQRPSFLSSFPRPSSGCGSSPVPYARPSSKSSPLSSSPKPFSSTSFLPIASSSPFNNTSTPTRHNFTPSPKILEHEGSTPSSPNIICALTDSNSKELVRLQEYNKNITRNEKLEHVEHTVNNKQGNADRNGLTNLLTEVDERIRFSLDFDHSTLAKPVSKQYEIPNINQVKESSPLKETKPDQAAQVMKDDLSQVKKDISDIRNELTVTKQGLENGRQPLLVRSNCVK